MKYVDNLLEVKPEEIIHVASRRQVQAIVKALKPMSADMAVVVIFEDGDSNSYAIDGRYGLDEGGSCFVFKPKKVKKLKPLHVILAENPEYIISEHNCIRHKDWDFMITSDMLKEFGKPIKNEDYLEPCWIEEVEE
jgi:hypothetical protein